MIKQLTAHCKPSKLMRDIHRANTTDLSVSSSAKLLATKTILGKTVRFYSTGEHVIEGYKEDNHDSQILRFAHASLLVGEGVGDKRALYVDANMTPVEIWLDGERLEDFLQRSKQAMKLGYIESDLVVYGDPIPKLRSLRDV